MHAHHEYVKVPKIHTFTPLHVYPAGGHLLGNMLTLWFFGTELVGMLGASTFLKVHIYRL